MFMQIPLNPTPYQNLLLCLMSGLDWSDLTPEEKSLIRDNNENFYIKMENAQ